MISKVLFEKFSSFLKTIFSWSLTSLSLWAIQKKGGDEYAYTWGFKYKLSYAN